MLTAEPPARTARESSRIAADLELCGSCGEGSRAAFSELVTRHRVPLLAYCGRLVGSDHAEDVLQQSLLKAWLALEERRADVANPRAWLFRIAHNQAMDYLRTAGAPWVELDCEWESTESTERAFEVFERLGRVSDGIRDLPARQREALMMHSLGGDSYADIAAKMETNVPTVSQLITRARARLREIPAVLPPWLVLRRLTGAARRATAGLGGGTKAVMVVATLATGAGVPVVADHLGRHAPGPARAQLDEGTSAIQGVRLGSPAHARAAAPRRAVGSRGASAIRAAKGRTRSGVTSRPGVVSATTPGLANSPGSAPAKSETPGGASHGHGGGTSGGGGSPSHTGTITGGLSVTGGVPGVASVDVTSGTSGVSTSTSVRLPAASAPVAAPGPPALPLPRRRAPARRRG